MLLGLGWEHCRDCSEEDTGCSAKPRAGKTLTGRLPTSAGQPRRMRVAVCLHMHARTHADKRLTVFNTYAHLTDQPIAHLRGQHP